MSNRTSYDFDKLAAYFLLLSLCRLCVSVSLCALVPSDLYCALAPPVPPPVWGCGLWGALVIDLVAASSAKQCI